MDKKFEDYAVGDKIAFILYDTATRCSEVKFGYGIVFFNNSKTILCAQVTGDSAHSMRIMEENKCRAICPFDEDYKEYFKDILNAEIDAFTAKLKKLTADERSDMLKANFDERMTRIKTVALRLGTAEDESECINRLLELCRLKEQIFEIKLNGIENIRRENGAWKARISRLKELISDIDKCEAEF